MASNDLIGRWAIGVWEGMFSPDCLSYTTISGYALQENILGWLNVRIGTCYQATGATGNGSVNFDITPDITPQELTLIGKKFEVDYYKHLAMANMGVAGGGGLPITSLAEGDSKIGFANPVNIGKEYRESAKDSQTELNYLVNSYIVQIQNGTMPRDVIFQNPPLPYNGGVRRES